jgi:hypothetical protein
MLIVFCHQKRQRFLIEPQAYIRHPYFSMFSQFYGFIFVSTCNKMLRVEDLPPESICMNLYKEVIGFVGLSLVGKKAVVYFLGYSSK